MDVVTDKIRTLKPTITESTLRTYKSLLRTMFKSLRGLDEFDPLYLIRDTESVLHLLSNMNLNSRKTRLSALVVLCQAFGEDCSVYRQQMSKDLETWRNEELLQKRTPKQEENWLPWKRILDIRENLRKETLPLWSKEVLDQADLNKLMDYVILCLYTYIPPRRLMDWSEFKLVNYDDTVNYMTSKEFVFNSFKTKKSYGRQTVEIPSSLMTVLKKWRKVVLGRSEWLLFDTKGGKLSQPGLNQKLNKIFGKNLSVNMLRHIYITEVLLKDAPKLTDLEEAAREMGHSTDTQARYRKE